ncbi:HEAT repeats [uncultured archaeon]|nr:HEAT repeats [uncultured archaeon]
MRDLLADEAADVRNTAVHFFTANPTADALPHLSPLLTDPEGHVANSAAEAVQTIGGPQAKDILATAYERAKTADETLEPYEKRVPAIVRALSNIVHAQDTQDEQTQTTAFADEPIERIFRETLRQPLCRTWAAKGLEAYDNPLSTPLLLDVLTQPDTRPEERDSILHVLANMGEESSIPVIRQLHDQNPTATTYLALAAHTVSSRVRLEARRELREYLTQPNHQVTVTRRSQEIISEQDGIQWLSVSIMGPIADENAHINMGRFLLTGEEPQCENTTELQTQKRLAQGIRRVADPTWEGHFVLEGIARWVRD